MGPKIILLIDGILTVLLIVVVASIILTIVFDRRSKKLTSERSEKASNASVNAFITLYFTALSLSFIWMALSFSCDNQRIEDAPSCIIQFHTVEWSTEYMLYDL